jgi:hypothetical protein
MGLFRDADGRHPQHTFFYAIDQYRPEHLDSLATLCAAGFGEIEVHLHHGHDTSEGLREKLEAFKSALTARGLLSRDQNGATRFAFIHGDWALDNSGPDSSTCGVVDEIRTLVEAGCYADFTMPSAPHPTQTRTVNQIYFAVDDPVRPKSHDRGVRAAVGCDPPMDGLLMIQGPLTLTWTADERRVLPRLENGEIHGAFPPSGARFKAWLRAGVVVRGRPEWVFVKLHTHGAVERNADAFFGPAVADFHHALANLAEDGFVIQLHYVTAREMANIAHAAIAGLSGDPNIYRDYFLQRRMQR